MIKNHTLLFLIILLTISCSKLTKLPEFTTKGDVQTIDNFPPITAGNFSILGASSTNTLTPKITWSASENVNSYVLTIDTEVDSNNNCPAPYIQRHSLAKVTEKTLENLPGGGTYYACVYAYTEEGIATKAQNSGTFSFKVTTHTAFITAATHMGDLEGLTGADSICQGEADSASLDGTFMAILSDSEENAKNRIEILGNVFDTNGNLIASNSTDFWDGTLGNSIKYTASGSELTSKNTWTGSDGTGTYSTNACSDWRNKTGTVNGSFGINSNTDSTWLSSATSTCSTANYLYCISAVEPRHVNNFKATPHASINAKTSLTLTVNIGATEGNTSQLVIRRKEGTTEPNKNCSDGTDTIVSTLSPPFTTSTIVDEPGIGFFSYRICAYDASSTLLYSYAPPYTTSHGTPKAFITDSTVVPANLDSAANADTICSADSSSASPSWKHLTSDVATWRLIHSRSTENAKDRTYFHAPLFNLAAERIASQSSDLWTGSLEAKLNISSSLNTINSQVWTGTQADGTKVSEDSYDHCYDWTSNEYYEFANVGNSNYLTNYWLTDQFDGAEEDQPGVTLSYRYCEYGTAPGYGTQLPVYCIAETIDPVTSFNAAPGGTAGTIDVTIALDGNANTSLIDKIDIRRKAGATAPNASCADGADTIVSSLTGTNISSQTITDTTGAGTFSYRMCIYNISDVVDDADALEDSSNIKENVTAP